MRTKFFFVFLVLILTLAACGKKGPVRPIGSSVPDNTENATGTTSKECCN